MSFEVALVPYGQITAHLGAVLGAGYLQKAAALTGGRCSIDDLVRFCYAEHFSLWVIFDPKDSKIVGFFLMEIKQYPQKRMACVQHCVTEPGIMEFGFDENMQTVLESYAKINKCAGIEFVGRLGWKKYVVKNLGYTCDSALYEVFFEEGPK